jgi:hypothetical protein
VSPQFPGVEEAGTLAICECRIRDEASVDAAVASPEASEKMADLPRFTETEQRACGR